MYKLIDATGAWLNNSTIVLQQDGGGKILLDPKYGIVAGTKNLFDTDGTTVLPGFIDKDGKMILDDDGMPKNSNFFLDLRDGTAYFRGNIFADNGYFSGELRAASGEFTGTVKAGIIEAGTIKGDLISDPDDGGWLVGCGIKVGQNPSSPNGYNFYVDPDGNVNINKGSISWGAVTGTDEIDQRIKDAQDAADDAYSEASSVNDDLLKLVKGQYKAPSATFISGTKVMSPTIEAGTIIGSVINGATINGGIITAGVGSEQYMTFGNHGINMYSGEVSTPKVRLDVGYAGTHPSLILGAGSDSTGNNNILFVQKAEGWAEIIYRDSDGKRSGFQFYPGGKIVVNGSLDVKAVFA